MLMERTAAERIRRRRSQFDCDSRSICSVGMVQRFTTGIERQIRIFIGCCNGLILACDNDEDKTND